MFFSGNFGEIMFRFNLTSFLKNSCEIHVLSTQM